MDHNVPGPITAGGRLRDVDCVTAEADGAERLADDDLLDRATTLDRVLVTLDGDFFAIAAERQMVGRDFAGVVHVDALRATAGRVIADLELIAKTSTPDDLRNRMELVPL